MANEPLARAFGPPDAPDEDGFLTLRAALSASARGRAFLAEYLRRNRYADTEAVLKAIARIEARLQADASAVERMRGDLRLLLMAVRLARPKIDAAGPAARAAKLSQLLDLFERRIEAMAPTPGEASSGRVRRCRTLASCRGAAARRAGITDPLAGQRAGAGHGSRSQCRISAGARRRRKGAARGR